MECQFDLIDAAAVNATTDRIDVFQDVDIGERLAGVEKFCIKDGKGRYKFIELFFYFFSMINISGRSKFLCDIN
jgi:hypothetical protein